MWGGSFLFMRVAANTFGPAYLIEFQVAFAAVALLMIALYLRKRVVFFKHIKHFFIIGLFNSAVPFLLFAYAAQTLNASTLAILNSTAPIWGALIGFVWYRSPLSAKAILGMMIGTGGVAVLVGLNSSTIGNEAIFPIGASLMASFSYGIATNYTKNARQVPAFDNAHGSMWAAVIWVLPLQPFLPIRAEPSTFEWGSVITLGVLCTGLAYLLYFHLVSEIGPTSALTVTFLVPVFGILWGYLILGEPIGFNTIIGTILVLSGTMLVTGFSPIDQAIKFNRLNKNS
ncbi:DMT family transporter [Vibrio parahaemolyticus]|nr:EamA family transporter [Vibrio parahaemolyticus]EGR0928946.1 DMT family transporter [Vibrio parahaemolyticus]EGR3230967.1 EamA/RhaT family transporter [Vibrio parahaemolyticus]EHH3728453.1 DMT family transporter [Vibrio parahaemolyticus]EIU6783096.1 DMT family transporter [Vibrio parahaemolyticus]